MFLSIKLIMCKLYKRLFKNIFFQWINILKSKLVTYTNNHTDEFMHSLEKLLLRHSCISGLQKSKKKQILCYSTHLYIPFMIIVNDITVN